MMVQLQRASGRWTVNEIAVEATVDGPQIPIVIEAPRTPLEWIQLRWHARVPEHWRILNDQWERSYGDLEWRGMAGNAYCPGIFWHRSAPATMAMALRPARRYSVTGRWMTAGIYPVAGRAQRRPRRCCWATANCSPPPWSPNAVHRVESAFSAAQQLLPQHVRTPRLPAAPVYGGNNWYYAYGKSSAEDIRCAIRNGSRNGRLPGRNRPFMVIDDGWSPYATAGPWDHGNATFPGYGPRWPPT